MSGRSTGPGRHSTCTCGSLKVHGSWMNVLCDGEHLHRQTSLIICSPLYSMYAYLFNAMYGIITIVNSRLVL